MSTLGSSYFSFGCHTLQQPTWINHSFHSLRTDESLLDLVWLFLVRCGCSGADSPGPQMCASRNCRMIVDGKFKEWRFVSSSIIRQLQGISYPTYVNSHVLPSGECSVPYSLHLRMNSFIYLFVYPCYTYITYQPGMTRRPQRHFRWLRQDWSRKIPEPKA